MLTLLPFVPAGSIIASDSKSHLHRLLFCAAAGSSAVDIKTSGFGQDIAATIRCLCALGAGIVSDGELLHVRPIQSPPDHVEPDVGESGTTLRFLLPLLGALGVSADILCRGRLPERPLSPLTEQLCAHGMEISRRSARISVRGQLHPGDYSMPGNVSSQFVSALLLALPLLDGESRLELLPPVESAGYIRMTEQTLRQAGVSFEKYGSVYIISGRRRPLLPRSVRAEGDWSNAAAFLCMGACSPAGVTVTGLSPDSCQPDRVVLDCLRRAGAEVSVSGDAVTVREGRHLPFTLDASQCPDLVPVLSVLASCAPGESRVLNAARLRLKESDRLSGIAALLCSLGARVTEQADGLCICGVSRFRSAALDTRADHRLAMAAAAAACHAGGALTLSDGACVSKSSPDFWKTYQALGGCCQ